MTITLSISAKSALVKRYKFPHLICVDMPYLVTTTLDGI